MKVIKFGAPWCGQCKVMANALKETPLNVPVEEISVDNDEKDLTSLFGVRSLPTLILLKGNNEIKRWVGITLPKEINDYIETL